jgi:lipopolysaccharide transport system permease protein
MLGHLRRLVGSRELVLSLARREIKIRYKQSLLGASWAILQPAAMTVIFTVVFSHFARIDTGSIPYPIFVYAALLPWTFFANSLSFGVPSIVNNMNLVTKIYFPREAFPLAAIAACFVDFLVGAVLFAGLMVYYRFGLSAQALWLPAVIGVEVMLALAVCLFLSAINVFFRDIRFAIPLLVQVWMFASPVVYPVSLVPERVRAFYLLNPMAGVVDSFRRVLLEASAPRLAPLMLAGLGAAILLVVSYASFKRLEMRFADVI